jgi:hypothetical protein
MTSVLVSGCLSTFGKFAATSGVVAADSSADHRALLSAAWRDQVAFERFRLSNLPRRWFPFTERPACHSAVGRFCLSEGDAAGAWKFMPEPPEIALKRLELIAALREIALRIPSDDWVAGQTVRYTVEAGLFDAAAQAVTSCGGTDWWCTALGGYVLHRWNKPAPALSAFQRALASMPAAERDRWTDPAPLLELAAADSLRALPAEVRIRFAADFWRIADPFYSRPGNES